MPTPQEATLDSDLPLVPNDALQCSELRCSAPAVSLWPTTSKTPSVYCAACLARVKHRLRVALGAASFIG